MLLQVSGFRMPAYVEDFTVAVSSYTSANVLLDNSEEGTFAFTSSPGTLKMALSQVNSNIVGALASVKIDLTVQNGVATNGYVKLKLPKWNPGTQRVSRATSMIQVSSSDTQSNGRFKIDCTSPAHANIACWFLPVTPASVSAIATTYDELYISGFTSALTTILSFTLTNSRFRNPASTKPLTTLIAETYNSGNFMLD